MRSRQPEPLAPPRVESIETRSSPTGYRADLDGLRGVAVLLVVVGHVWVGRVTGGVDAFLLLGGFFVGASTLRRASTRGLGFASFSVKVFRRFLPVIVPMVLAVVVVGALVYPPTRWADLAEQAIASTAMVQNFWLAAEGTVYGGADVGASPFQHLWSLSIQLQSYILLAGLLVALAFFVQRGRLPIRPVLGAVVALLALASFIYATVRNTTDPIGTYFDTGARAWQFLAGIIVAWAVARFTLPTVARVVVGWVGMALLVSTMIIVDGATAFPGPAALLPISGAALMIVAGSAPTRFGVDRILRSRVLLGMGAIAFGVYVWHWPILVFYREATGHADVEWAAGLAIIGASVVLGMASLSFIERPFQRQRVKRVQIGFLVAALLIVVALPSAWLVQVHRISSTSSTETTRAEGDGSSVQATDSNVELSALLRAEIDAPAVYADKCIARGREVVTCAYGDADSDRVLALVGGSHSAQWFDAFERAATEHGFALVTYLRDECYFGEPGLDLYLSDDCDAWNNAVAQQLIDDGNDIVVTTSTRSNVFDGKRTEWVPAGYLASWERLSDAGLRVIAIRDSPWLDENPIDCLSAAADPLSCAVPRDDVLLDSNPLESMRVPVGVTSIDLNDLICAEDFCPAVRDGMVVYRDDNHLTSTFVLSLVSEIDERLGGATGWW